MSEGSGTEVETSYIECDEGKENPDVSPTIVIADVESVQIGVRGCCVAVSALIRGLRVRQIPTGPGDVWTEVL